jgi:hypothetical protein
MKEAVYRRVQLIGGTFWLVAALWWIAGALTMMLVELRTIAASMP